MNRKILVVEDIKQHLTATLKVLKKEGYDPISVVSIEDAISALEDDDFCCILLDYWIPKEKGLQLLKDGGKKVLEYIEKLSNDHVNHHIPVIVISNHLLSIDLDIEYAKSGKLYTLNKLSLPDEVVEKVNDVLEG